MLFSRHKIFDEIPYLNDICHQKPQPYQPALLFYLSAAAYKSAACLPWLFPQHPLGSSERERIGKDNSLTTDNSLLWVRCSIMKFCGNTEVISIALACPVLTLATPTDHRTVFSGHSRRFHHSLASYQERPHGWEQRLRCDCTAPQALAPPAPWGCEQGAHTDLVQGARLRQGLRGSKLKGAGETAGDR